MRIIPLFLLICLSFFLNAQKMAIGGYITPAYGNIAYKSDFYNPVFTIGGGLNLNYYKNRWLFNTGLNFKNAGASEKKPSLNIMNPDGSYVKTVAFKYSMHILTLPVGVNYAIVNNENFKLFTGLTAENGVVLKKQVNVKIKEYDYKNFLSLSKSYYIGIMPEIRMEWNISIKAFLFSNIGLSYQLNNSEKTLSFPEWNESYKINNFFMDIGFGYRLKN